MVEVRGESHYVAALERLVSAQGVNLKRVDEFDLDDIWLRLIPEPTNPYDPRALMVASSEGDCLGHIGRENAAKYAEIITELAGGHDLWCRAQIGGGRYDDGWRIGVWVFMVSPGDLAKQAGRVAAQSVATLESKWREATIIHTGAMDNFTATLAQMRAADQDPDGEHMQFARAGLEKAIRSYARAVKALQQAVNDFHGNP